MVSRQKTLFQSWIGSVSNRRIDKKTLHSAEDRVRKDESPVQAIVDPCNENFDDEDDLLAQALEDSKTSFESINEDKSELKLSVRRSGKHFFRQPQSTLLIKYDNENSTDTDFDMDNISLGCDDIEKSLPVGEIQDVFGFDKQAGRLWIYPTNYPVRDYQYNIVQRCLYKNTLVTLPTGLGKTFIAAVVMYNFYRWYPQGKVVFMAPTKPLVGQQIEACYNIMGIPRSDTAEMTGNMNPTERRQIWKERRVFFLTPQVMTNDLCRGTCPAVDVKCLVIDEAHRAMGNHAYCQVVREMVKYTQEFRILALSATPGSDIKAVQQVISNLLVAQIELRTDECLDIKPYTHECRVDKIVVPLGEELSSLKNKYIQIMNIVVQRLIRQRALYDRELTSLSKFLILKARDGFRQDPPQQLPRQQYGVVEGDFALALSLFHGYELLQLHGLRSLHNFLEGIVNGEKGHGRTRTELLNSPIFREIMEILRAKFQKDDSTLSCTQKKACYVSAHPKMKKLEEVVLEHFNKIFSAGSTETRVMIFSQYRDSVQEITDLLNLHQPRVNAMSFIGQSSAGKSTKGFTQKEQLKVMKEFREGGYNILVSTCVGEEGLDIGDVDLIICFDAHKSPIRLVQRMGRTGRKRQGRVVMLVTEGKEEQIYNKCQYSKRSINKAVMNGARSLHFYKDNPRMLPEGLTPSCHKMFITVKQMPAATNVKPIKNQKQITSISKRLEGMNDELTSKEYEELREFLVPGDKIRSISTYPSTLVSLDPLCQIDWGPDDNIQLSKLSLNEWMPWQNRLQETRLMSHSLRSRHLVELVEFIQLQELLEADDDNNYGLEMDRFLNLDDVLEPGQTDTQLESARCGSINTGQPQQQRQQQQGLSAIKGLRKEPVRQSEIVPVLTTFREQSDEDLPMLDLGARTTNRHVNKEKTKSDYNKVFVVKDETQEKVEKRHRAEKEHRGKKRKVSNDLEFLDLITIDDVGDLKEDTMKVENQQNELHIDQSEHSTDVDKKDDEKAMSLSQNISSKKIITINDLVICTSPAKKKLKISTPPPFEEVETVFHEIQGDLPPLDLVQVVSLWYMETLQQNVQVKWTSSENQSPNIPVYGSNNELSGDDTKLHFDLSIDSDKPGDTAQGLTSVQTIITSRRPEVCQSDRSHSEKASATSAKLDTYGKLHKRSSTGDEDKNNINETKALLNKIDVNRTPDLSGYLTAKSCIHKPIIGSDSACVMSMSNVTAPLHSDSLTFTQAMACVQSSEEQTPEELQPIVHIVALQTSDLNRDSYSGTDEMIGEMPSFKLFDEELDFDITKDNLYVRKSVERKKDDILTTQDNSIDRDEEFDMPQFELEFDFDDDIIPPSPQTSQQFTQMSFNRSQSVLSTKERIYLCSNPVGNAIPEESSVESLTDPQGTVDDSHFDDHLSSCKRSSGHQTHDITVPQTAMYKAKPSTVSSLSTTEHNIPKSPFRFGPLLSKIRSSTPKQLLTKFTNVKCLYDGQVTQETCSVALTSSAQANDCSFLHMMSHGGEEEHCPAFKTPSRPAAQHRKKLQFELSSDEKFNSSNSGSSKSNNLSDSRDISTSIYDDTDDNDFQPDTFAASHTCEHNSNNVNGKKARKKKTKNQRKKGCDFLDVEAVLSGTEASSDENCNTADEDDFEDSFVNDNTEMSQLDEDMHAVYLESVQDRMETDHKFRLQPKHYEMNVFSQLPPEDESQYEEDSFCVAEGHEETVYFDDKNDLLDDLEKFLRQSKRRGKNNKSKAHNGKTRKRIRHISGSSSSEEEKSCAAVSELEDSQLKPTSRDVVHHFLCSQKSDPSTRKKKVIMSSSDEETSPHMTDQDLSRSVLVSQSVSTRIHVAHDSTEGLCTAPATLDRQREMRLTKQKLKQEEFRQKMAGKIQTSECVNSVDIYMEQVGRPRPARCERDDKADQFQGRPSLCPVPQTSNVCQNYEFVSNQLSKSVAKPKDFSSTRYKDRVVVLVNSREISGAQDIISSLRLKHGFTVAVRRLVACDYILSNRLAVDRRNMADFSNGVKRGKLTERIQQMSELYERCCLIVEQVRLKTTEKGNRTSHRTKYYDWIQSLLVQTNVRLFYTENEEETSTLLAQLAELEMKKEMNITVPINSNPDKEQVIQFYASIPKLNYAHALNLSQSFPSITQFITRCTPKSVSMGGHMSEVRGAEVCCYLRRKFDLQMLPTKH